MPRYHPDYEPGWKDAEPDPAPVSAADEGAYDWPNPDPPPPEPPADVDTLPYRGGNDIPNIGRGQVGDLSPKAAREFADEWKFPEYVRTLEQGQAWAEDTAKVTANSPALKDFYLNVANRMRQRIQQRDHGIQSD